MLAVKRQYNEPWT